MTAAVDDYIYIKARAEALASVRSLYITGRAMPVIEKSPNPMDELRRRVTELGHRPIWWRAGDGA